jgi:hypothetical protein
MDWSNERYVRLYCNDTKSWKLLGWEGQAVFSLLLRKVDRSGMLDDVYDAEDIALMLGCGFPVDVADRGLSRLVKKGTIEITDRGLLIPNFIEAQETPKSDRQRQRDSREAKRAKAKSAVTKRDNIVTERDNSSHGVTDGHTVSHGVTLCCADPVLCSTSAETYIYKNSKVENEQDKTRQPNSSSIKTSKVNLQPLDEALEFLPKLEDRNLARFILTVWSDCTTADAIAWVQQAKPYLLQLDGDHMRWLEDISTSKSPNDPVYDINGRNRLHQWLMNCLKNTVKKQKHAASKTGGKVEQQLEKLGRLRNERIRREAQGDHGHRGEDVCADDGGIPGTDRVF